MKWRVIYSILWLLTLIAYSVPWARTSENVFIGWNFTMPFSITYLIGLLIGLIVLAIKWKPVEATILAGILEFLGIAGAYVGIGAGAIIGALAREEMTSEWGIGLAFLVVLIYTVLGAIAGKKMIVKEQTK
ncbi:MAG: hypothetical protein DRJ47_06990 [Thermoprotei archaeon]|nr:MAG: hypothetical protein DRJ47_06990 [Thermoprotei archaeon]